MMTFSKSTFMQRMRLAVLVVACVIACATTGLAQSNASLSGIVSDAAGARVPDAKISVVNTKSGDKREGVTNRQGIFQFNALPAGTYELVVGKQGFSTLTEHGIELHPNDTRSLSELHLTVGEVTDDVTVEAAEEPPTNGERVSLISAGDISRLSTVGRDVSELLKTQAGFGLVSNGLDNGGGSDPAVVDPAGGSGLGNFVGNGATGNGATITSDGANVTDPVTGTGQTQTVNMDMVSEVKIETSNYGADVAHGPTVITAVGKSGTQNFHGSAYVHGRAYPMNATDWYAKFIQLPRLQDRYMYPGFNVTGPVVIPGTSLNKDKKLTFFLGAEDYIQRNVYAYGSPLNSYLQALVPTDQASNADHHPGMRQGNFTEQELASYIGVDPSRIETDCTPSGTLAPYIHVCAPPTTNNVNGATLGTLNPALFDQNAVNLMKFWPLPNHATINGYNYSQQNLENVDLWQARARLDYAMDDLNKFYVVFNAEQGSTSGIPEAIGNSPSVGSGQGGLPTPGKINSNINSYTGSANYTHIFGPGATNEVFGAISYRKTSFFSGNPSALLKSTYGYGLNGLYSRASCAGCGSDDIPQFNTYSSQTRNGFPLLLAPDFSNGPQFTTAFLPSWGDNYSVLIKSHTLKFGLYMERDAATQTQTSSGTNGQISSFYVGSGAFNDAACPGTTLCHVPDAGGAYPNSSSNYLADFFFGIIGSYSQQNLAPQTHTYFWTSAIFGTDSWKVNKRLTLDYGIRIEHLGAWTDSDGIGLATFRPSLYASDAGAAKPGLRWHGGTGPNSDSSVPLSGNSSRLAFFSPRAGLAWDVYGTGRTIFRGGWGMFRGSDPQNEYFSPVATAHGQVTSTYQTTSGVSLEGIDAAPLSTQQNSTIRSAIYAVDPTDDRKPLTETYSVTVSQRMIKNSIFEIAYVGNKSTQLLTSSTSGLGDIRNVNAIPIGGLFGPDPNPLSTSFGLVQVPESMTAAIQSDYRPFPAYAKIDVPRHVSYANYNALQVSFNKQKGHLAYGLNYTWSRASGVRGGYRNGPTQNPFDFRANYGPLAFDRTNIFNASYSYDVGKALHVNRFVNAVGNGWFISGITSLQSGPNLQASYSPNFNLSGNTCWSIKDTTVNPGAVPCADPATGQNTTGALCGSGNCTLDNKTVLGTPDVVLTPIIRASSDCPTGSPTENLHKNQFVNGSCFAIPNQGTNGPANLGYIRGPHFESSDLSVQRRFAFNEKRNFELRVSAFNFLNHPIISFNSHNPQEAALFLNGVDFPSATLLNKTNTAPSGPSCSGAGSTCFGYAGYKTGRRVMEITLRYNY